MTERARELLPAARAALAFRSIGARLEREPLRVGAESLHLVASPNEQPVNLTAQRVYRGVRAAELGAELQNFRVGRLRGSTLLTELDLFREEARARYVERCREPAVRVTHRADFEPQRPYSGTPPHLALA